MILGHQILLAVERQHETNTDDARQMIETLFEIGHVLGHQFVALLGNQGAQLGNIDHQPAGLAHLADPLALQMFEPQPGGGEAVAGNLVKAAFDRLPDGQECAEPQNQRDAGPTEEQLVTKSHRGTRE